MTTTFSAAAETEAEIPTKVRMGGITSTGASEIDLRSFESFCFLEGYLDLVGTNAADASFIAFSFLPMGSLSSSSSSLLA